MSECLVRTSWHVGRLRLLEVGNVRARRWMGAGRGERESGVACSRRGGDRSAATTRRGATRRLCVPLACLEVLRRAREPEAAVECDMVLGGRLGAGGESLEAVDVAAEGEVVHVAVAVVIVLAEE